MQTTHRDAARRATVPRGCACRGPRCSDTFQTGWQQNGEKRISLFWSQEEKNTSMTLSMLQLCGEHGEGSKLHRELSAFPDITATPFQPQDHARHTTPSLPAAHCTVTTAEMFTSTHCTQSLLSLKNLWELSGKVAGSFSADRLPGRLLGFKPPERRTWPSYRMSLATTTICRYQSIFLP